MNAPDVLRQYVVDAVPFALDVSGNVSDTADVFLPREAYILHVAAGVTDAWLAVYSCPHDQTRGDSSVRHCLAAVPMDGVIPIGAWRLVNVTEGFRGVSIETFPEGRLVPVIAWYAAP